MVGALHTTAIAIITIILALLVLAAIGTLFRFGMHRGRESRATREAQRAADREEGIVP